MLDLKKTSSSSLPTFYLSMTSTLQRYLEFRWISGESYPYHWPRKTVDGLPPAQHCLPGTSSKWIASSSNNLHGKFDRKGGLFLFMQETKHTYHFMIKLPETQKHEMDQHRIIDVKTS